MSYETIKSMINLNNTLISCLLSDLPETSTKQNRRYHVSPYLKGRDSKGRFHTAFDDLAKDSSLFKENFHMSLTTFEKLYELTLPHLLPKKVIRKDVIMPKMKLAMVVEFLASGDLQRHLSSCYRISKQHFGNIIDQVCDAIANVLGDQIPKWNEENMKSAAEQFENKFNFPNCVGAVDGKHVIMKAPPNSGSLFFNYKGFFSIVIMAICDADSKFTFLDVGAYGSEGDANVFRNSDFGSAILQDRLRFPEDKDVGGASIPYFVVADDAFPLCKRIMKPFAGKVLSNEERIFNYRLSRARMCIEHTFGILAWRWLCLQKKLFCKPDRAQKIVTACCLLHNFLVNNDSAIYMQNPTTSEESNVVFGSALGRLKNSSGRTSENAKSQRNALKDYVCSPSGSVPWQNKSAGIL